MSTLSDPIQTDVNSLLEQASSLLTSGGDRNFIFTILSQAHQLNPTLRGLNALTGYFFEQQSDFYKSYNFYKRELELHPEIINSSKADLLHSLAWHSSNLGRCEESVYFMSEVIKLSPCNSNHYSDLLYFANHVESYTDQDLSEIAKTCYHLCFEKQFEKERQIIKDKLESTDYNNSKIRVGILSSNIHSHSAERLLIDILEHLPKQSFEFYCYYTENFEDSTTNRFKNISKKFMNLKGKAPLSIAEEIVTDKINILLDTLGHVKGNHLDVFSLKPAPIQISCIGFWGSTGLPQMDYLISQCGWIREEEKDLFTETIIDLPIYYYDVKDLARKIPIEKPPHLTNGFITFGCLNRGQKINHKMLCVWSVILNHTPNSKLILSYHSLQEPEFRTEVWKIFELNGINQERILLLDSINTEQYYHLYNQIDIALDPFPFSGGCTTIDTLWMGTPLITKCGNKTAGRFSEAYLKFCECEELIAPDEQEYVLKAIELANDSSKIENYKNTLRDRLIESKILDPKEGAKNLSNVFEQIIHQKSTK